MILNGIGRNICSNVAEKIEQVFYEIRIILATKLNFNLKGKKFANKIFVRVHVIINVTYHKMLWSISKLLVLSMYMQIIELINLYLYV